MWNWMISDKKRSGYQVESFTATQVFHRFVGESELVDELVRLSEDFKQVHAFTENEEAALKISKKGKIFVMKQALKQKKTVETTHDRKKNTLLPEDEVIGEERTKYMTRRITWIAVCGILVAILQVTSIILRILEII